MKNNTDAKSLRASGVPDGPSAARGALKHPDWNSKALALLCGLAFTFTGDLLAARGGKPLESAPDFTKGGQRDESHDWTLGPTGARGWIYSANGHSHDARQILITDVAKGSPADGVLQKDDAILGVEGKAFTGDARVQFANAVALAESETGGGKLRLLRWRAGKADTAELKLQVLGSYSATAPYACPKSKRIFELGCKSLAARMSDEKNYTKALNPIPRSMNALALLASGNKEWLPLVKREAEWAANFSADGFATWYYGYVMMLASEYTMATGDQSVMPGLKRLALEAAHGQSAVGTWGHKFAMPNGNLNGYGSMNQPGITLMIGMALAREAGVKDPDLDRAIDKGVNFLRWFADKGAVPYGDHQPYPGHEDNGKCSSAAVLYDLIGDRGAAEFFSKMATAAYDEREQGHTGNYFNVLWALPGVARCGPMAIGAYMKEQAWYYDLARGWDGAFNYQGSPVGEEEHGKYTNWDCSGGYLLAYGLPLKSLRLTGRKPFCVPALNAAQVADVIAAGRDYSFRDKDPIGYSKRTNEQLMAGISSWSPTVRKRSAAELGKRQGEFVPALMKLLASSNADARYGACEALGALGPKADAAAPQLRAALKDPDPWLESLAAEALPMLGAKVRTESVSDLLAMTLRTNPGDPRRMVQRAAAEALFSPFPGRREPKSILAESLDGVDRKLLYPAIQSMLANEDSVTRGSLGRIYGKLTDEDVVAVLPSIIKAVDKLAPSDEMFGDGIRLAGLDLLSRLHIREGMALCVSIVEPTRWGAGKRLPKCVEYLTRYGAQAKAMMPQLQQMRGAFDPKGAGKTNEELAALDSAIAKITASTDTPTLVDSKDFKPRK